MVHCQKEYFAIDFRLELTGIFILNLAVFQHFLDFMVLVHQQIVLCSPMLYCLYNFGKHLLNMFFHVLLALFDLDTGLAHDLTNEIFAFNNSLQHRICFIVSLDEVNDHVV